MVALVCMAALSGCSGRDESFERTIVHGKVTYDGQPVVSGEIRFVPIRGTTGPSSGAVIEQGNYRIDGHGGVPQGTHRVVIIGFMDEGPAVEDVEPDGGAMPDRPTVPAKYNTESALVVEIDAPSQMQQNFALER